MAWEVCFGVLDEIQSKIFNEIMALIFKKDKIEFETLRTALTKLPYIGKFILDEFGSILDLLLQVLDSDNDGLIGSIDINFFIKGCILGTAVVDCFVTLAIQQILQNLPLDIKSLVIAEEGKIPIAHITPFFQSIDRYDFLGKCVIN